MDDGRSWCTILSVIFGICSFFFSLSAATVVSVNDAQLKERTDTGDTKAVRLSRCLDIPNLVDRIRTTASVTAMLSSLFGMTVLNPTLFPLLLNLLGETESQLAAVLSILVSILVMTIVVISFELLIPNMLGHHHAEGIGYAVASFYPGLLWIFTPLTVPIRGISLGIAHLFGADPGKDAETVTEEEIRMLVDTGSEMGFIEESQKEMINNIFEFDDTTAADVMTHRTEMIAVEKNAKVSDVVHLATSEGFSRLPVFDGDLDNILGFIHVKDLLCLVGMNTSENLKLDDFIRPVIYVPEHVKCRSIFAEFKKSKTAMAVVVDDYGGTEGILTMEDILESIVGDIEDEYDEEEKTVQQVDADTYVVEGTVELEDLVELLHIRFEEDEDYDTLGGFMTHMLGRIPKENENPAFEYEGYQFTVMRVEERRVSKVKIFRLPQPEEPEHSENSQE
ncbi:MAG: hemolysin family protein [Candidatus Merdivicinus sp.]